MEVKVFKLQVPNFGSCKKKKRYRKVKGTGKVNLQDSSRRK